MATLRKRIPGFKRLSKQETRVFKMLLQDYKGSEIGEKMGLNEKTISTYKLRILQKTKTKGIVGMYLFNLKYELVDLLTGDEVVI